MLYSKDAMITADHLMLKTSKAMVSWYDCGRSSLRGSEKGNN